MTPKNTKAPQALSQLLFRLASFIPILAKPHRKQRPRKIRPIIVRISFEPIPDLVAGPDGPGGVGMHTGEGRIA